MKAVLEVLEKARKFRDLPGLYAALARSPKTSFHARASASWRDNPPSYSMIAARSS